jgi:hypothetical protein
LFLGLEVYDFIGEIGLKCEKYAVNYEKYAVNYEKYAVLSTGSDGLLREPCCICESIIDHAITARFSQWRAQEKAISQAYQTAAK